MMLEAQNLSVLIVDDMENMVKSVRGMLKVLKVGKSFHFANNGQQAWALLQKETVDLAIIDWNMPVMTGVELLGRIREDRDKRDMPVVMVTAEANREIVAEAAESDIDAYILKPLTVKSLGDKIQAVIENANNPPPVIQHLKNARALEESGDLDGAIAEGKLAMKAEPKSSRPIRELGFLYFKKDDLATAEKYFLTAAKMNQLDVFAFHQLGELYLRQDDIERAAKYFDKAMSISPRHVSRGIYFGKVLVKKGMVKRAIKVFDQAITLSDDPLSLSEEIGNLCLQTGIYNYTVKLFETILKSLPNRTDLMFKLGLAYEKMGEHRKALDYMVKVTLKEKENVSAHLHAAVNYMRIGQVLRADQSLQSVLRLDPDNEQAKELLKRNI